MDRMFKWHMLITSFIPLWVSVLFITIWDMCSSSYCSLTVFLKSKHVGLLLMVAILVVTFSSIISLSRFFVTRGKSTKNSGVARVLTAKKASNLVSDFLLAYILPMIAFDFTDLQSTVLFLIYFAVLAFLNIRNNNVYVNINLEFLGYRIYECELECYVMGEHVQRSGCMVFSKRDLVSYIGAEVAYFDFDNDKYIDLSHSIKGV